MESWNADERVDDFLLETVYIIWNHSLGLCPSLSLSFQPQSSFITFLLCVTLSTLSELLLCVWVSFCTAPIPYGSTLYETYHQLTIHKVRMCNREQNSRKLEKEKKTLSNCWLFLYGSKKFGSAFFSFFILFYFIIFCFRKGMPECGPRDGRVERKELSDRFHVSPVIHWEWVYLSGKLIDTFIGWKSCFFPHTHTPCSSSSREVGNSVFKGWDQPPGRKTTNPLNCFKRLWPFDKNETSFSMATSSSHSPKYTHTRT